MRTREQVEAWLEDRFPDGGQVMLADGLEDAFLGIVERYGEPPVAAYDKAKVLDIFRRRDGMTPEDAQEFFDFNVIGAGVGPLTPVFLTRATFTKGLVS